MDLFWIMCKFSHSVVSNFLWPHGLQYARLPCPSPTPGACSGSCPLNQWCHPIISFSVILLLLPSIFPSIRVSSIELALRIRWPKYSNFSISPSKEYSGLIFFRIAWFDLLAVQGTLKSLLQHHSSEVSILWHSLFFMVQLSHPYITAGKTIPLIVWIFVGKVMFLLFNTLFRLVIGFLPRSKHLLISVTICSDFGAQENKVCHCFHCFLIYSPWSNGPDAMILAFWMVGF